VAVLPSSYGDRIFVSVLSRTESVLSSERFVPKTRRQRSFVGLVFVAIAILIFGVFLRGYEVANGHPFLRLPKAEDGVLVIVGLALLVFLPYLVGINVARVFWRSRVRSSARININKAAPNREPH